MRLINHLHFPVNIRSSKESSDKQRVSNYRKREYDLCPKIGNLLTQGRKYSFQYYCLGQGGGSTGVEDRKIRNGKKKVKKTKGRRDEKGRKEEIAHPRASYLPVKVARRPGPSQFLGQHPSKTAKRVGKFL